MENLIVLTLAYIVLVGIFYPRHTTVTESQSQPINYFPEPLEETTEPEPKAIAATPKQTTAQDLTSTPIRKLYTLASQQKIKDYKKLSKTQLIAALT